MQNALGTTGPSVPILLLLTSLCLAQGPQVSRPSELRYESKLLRFALSRRTAQPLVAGNSGVIRLTSEHELSGTLLPAGYYQIRCEHQRDGHELVLRKVSRDWRGAYERVEGEVARVKCKMEGLAHKAPATAFHAERQPTGRLKIAEVHIGGEKVRHLLE